MDLRLRVGQAGRRQAVVEAPPDVAGADARTVGPPAVALREGRVLRPEGVGEAMVGEQRAEGSAFLVGEAGVAAV
ncbi:MAG: hypothetical protein EBS87_10905, partial [Sphingomonadaceae bacterium]|nr:hypothetical protein [Sphingomonadaceae bacterium]